MSEEPKRASYVDRVRADTSQYARELLSENDKLRSLLRALEEQATSLRERLVRAQEELDRYRVEGLRLHEQLARTEKDGEQFAARYVEVERENSNLANLYVASYRLHSTLERSEVLEVIHEIVTNLVGCEEMVLYETRPDGVLSALSAQGLDKTLLRPIPFGVGLIGQAAETGETYVAPTRDGAGGRGEEAHLTACVPLRLGERVIGALALFRLLPQKAGLELLDRELFDLLATHAATALYCSELHATRTAPRDPA
jgi:hypothetical protein